MRVIRQTYGCFYWPSEMKDKLKGSSYKLKNIETDKDGKRHSAHLSPCPDELLHFVPTDGPDNDYGQLNNPIKNNPYTNAGLKEFAPLEPHSEIDALLTIPKEDNDLIIFLSLEELNADLVVWNNGKEDVVYADESLCADIEVSALARSQAATKKCPPLPVQAPPAPHILEIGPLTSSVLELRRIGFFLFLTASLVLPKENGHLSVSVLNAL